MIRGLDRLSIFDAVSGTGPYPFRLSSVTRSSNTHTLIQPFRTAEMGEDWIVRCICLRVALFVKCIMYLSKSMQIYEWACVNMQTCFHTHIHTHTYGSTHTHTHTHLPLNIRHKFQIFNLWTPHSKPHRCACLMYPAQSLLCSWMAALCTSATSFCIPTSDKMNTVGSKKHKKKAPPFHFPPLKCY